MNAAGWYRWDGTRLVLQLKILPRSARTTVVEVRGAALVVKIKSPPADGRANAELVEYLSKQFDVPKGDVHVLRGANARNKIVAVDAPARMPEGWSVAGGGWRGLERRD